MRRFYKILKVLLVVLVLLVVSIDTHAARRSLRVDFGAWTEMGVGDDVASECPNVRRWHAVVSARPSAST